MSDYKLDVFALIGAMQRKQFDYYAKLTTEQRKGFAPVVVQRWLSGTESELQLVMVNEYVNPYVFTLAKHPELLCKLMTVAAQSSGRVMYPKTLKKESKKTLSIEVLRRAYSVSESEARDMVDRMPIEQIIDAAYDLGYDTTEMKKLKKELT